MNKIARFVIWICSKFTRAEIEEIIKGLSDVLANRNPEVKPKDDFKEKHPNYRNFFVDPTPPLKAPAKLIPEVHYKDLLADYQERYGNPFLPVKVKDLNNIVPEGTICKRCSAPAEYLYFNDGKKRSQVRCKVCGGLSQVHPGYHRETKYFCPHCSRPLYLWKENKDVSIYKCGYDKCPVYLSAKSKLNFRERVLAKIKSSQFKLRYQYRDYHFTKEQLRHSAPEKPEREGYPFLFNIRNSLNTLALSLTFHISLGLSARQTAFVLRNVFSIPVSYQTVLNYAEASAYYCHQFNLAHKGEIDNAQAGDETYVKIKGKQHYTFFFISSKNRKITAYHVADSRDTLPAVVSMEEAIRTAQPGQEIIMVSDGNPSYPAGILFINQSHQPNLTHKKVIGLQNLDTESETYRPFKEIIERLNRTYKFHTRAACGFNSFNGAVALTTLFVTHYNFLRPHTSLGYKTPIQLEELEGIPTLQGKWAKVVQMATNSIPA